MYTNSPRRVVLAAFVFLLAIYIPSARGGSVLDLPAGTPILAGPFAEVDVGAPNGVFHATLPYSWIFGHVAPFPDEDFFTASLDLTINLDGDGKATDGSFLVQIDFDDGFSAL